MKRTASELTENARGKLLAFSGRQPEGVATTGRLARIGVSILGLVLAVSALASAADEERLRARGAATAEEVGARLPVERPRSVAQAKSGKRRLYAATLAELFVSEDGGRRWDPLPLPLAAKVDILAMAVDPRDERRLYVGGRGGLWNSADAGATWAPIDVPARFVPRALAVAAATPVVLYVGTDRDGVLRSPDGGASWVPGSLGLPEELAGGRPASIRSVAVHPSNPDLAYAATELHGLYRTTNGGALWTPINKGLGPFPLRWRTGGPRLLLDPLDPHRLLAFVIRPVHSHRLQTRFFQTSDGGEHWLPLELELPGGEQGVALAVNPADLKGVLLFTTRGALALPWPPRAEGVRPEVVR